MNRLVAASASVGWTNTLFSRHSTLNVGLPAATCTTGSPTSMTVRWFNAVFRCTMRVRSLVSVSIFCATAGISTAASTANINTTRLMVCLFLPLFQCCTSRRLPPKSPGRLWLVGFKQRRNIPRGELGPPLGVGKNHFPVAYFAASRLDRELADSLQYNGRAFLVAVGEHFPRLRDPPNRIGEHVVQQRRVRVMTVAEHVPRQVLQKCRLFVAGCGLAFGQVPRIEGLSAIQIDIDHTAAHQIDQRFVRIPTLQNRYGLPDTPLPA